MQNNMIDFIDGIQLEDVVVPDDAIETTRDDGAELNTVVVIRSFYAPFVLTVVSSWAIRNGAIWIWFASLAAGLYYLVRRMPMWQAAIVTVVYIPLMFFIFLFVISAVPTGFHFRE